MDGGAPGARAHGALDLLLLRVGCGVLVHGARDADDRERINRRRGVASGQRRAAVHRARRSDSARSPGPAAHPQPRGDRAQPRRRVDWAWRWTPWPSGCRASSSATARRGAHLRPAADRGLPSSTSRRAAAHRQHRPNSRLCMSAAVTAYRLAFGMTARPPAMRTSNWRRRCCSAAATPRTRTGAVPPARGGEGAVGACWIVVDPRRTDTAAIRPAISPAPTSPCSTACSTTWCGRGCWTGFIKRIPPASRAQLLREYTPRRRRRSAASAPRTW